MKNGHSEGGVPMDMKENSRNYGVDLLRVLSILMVVFIHVLNRGGIFEATKTGTASREIVMALWSVCLCAVNCYALISGYVGLYAHHRYSGLLHMWLQVVFRSFLITLIFGFFFPESVSVKVVIKSLFPVTFNGWWYFTAYFALFFLMPILNEAVEKMPRKKILFSLAACFVLFTVLPRIRIDVFLLDKGLSLLWLAYLYVLGAYCRKYLINAFAKWKLLLAFGVAALAIRVSAVIDFLIDGTEILPSYYNSPDTTIAALALLLLFSELRIENLWWKKSVQFVSALTFGIYLLHMHPLIKERFLKGNFAGYAALPPILMLLAILGTVLAIFLLSGIAEFLLQIFFRFCRRIEDKMPIKRQLEKWFKNRFPQL